MPRLASIRTNRALKFAALSLFFLALTLFLFRNLIDGEYITGTDAMSTVLWPKMQAAGDSFFSTWDYFVSAGMLSYQSPAYAASNAIMLGLLQVPAVVYAKLQFTVSFWLAGMLSFYVLRAMTSSDKAAFLGSLVYIGNGAFIGQIVEGHLGFVTAYPFLILIFYLFYDAYINGISKKTIALPAILLLYGGFAAPHMVFLAAVMMIAYAASDLIFRLLARRRERFIYKIALTAFLSFVLVLPVAYAILVLGGSSAYGASYTIEDAANGSNWLLGALTLGGAELTNTYAVYGVRPGAALMGATQLLALPLFFLALLSLLVENRRKLTVPLWVAAAFTILLSMGPNSPLGFLFTLAYDNIPLIDSFRALSRFSMVTAVFYSVLIAVLVANLGEVSQKLRRMAAGLAPRFQIWIWKVSGRPQSILVAVLLISSLSGLAVLADGNAVRAFHMPSEYTEPFEYIETEDGNGYYKIYTLPMLGDLYNHPDRPNPTSYGYPKGTTLDPGAYLPVTINERGMSHFVTSSNYWAGMRDIMDVRQFGYQSTLQLLGSSAAVKYVVDQWYAPDEEKGYFASMNGGIVVAEFDSGARVIMIDSFSSPLKAQSGLIVGSGGIDTMYLLLGAGVFDPSNDAYASFQWADENSIENILGASELIVLRNGDLLELGYELGYMDDILFDLPSAVNEHRSNDTTRWVQYVDSGAGEVGVTTNGTNSLTVEPSKDVDYGSNLKFRALFGPDQGVLEVKINGQVVSYVDTSAPFTGWEWFTVDVPSDVERIDSVTFTGSDDGKAVTISDAAIFAGDTEKELVSQVKELLSPYRSKIGYVYTPLYLYLHDPSIEVGNWDQGNGVMSFGSSLNVPVSTVFDSDLRLSVYAPDWGSRSVEIDGTVMTGPWNSSGAYHYELGIVAAGTHDLRVFGDGTYGLTLLPEYESAMIAPTISYEQVSSTEWRVSVTNASGPFILKFSEGTSEFWTIDGADATWFRSDYLANAFIVNGTGDLQLTLLFSKQAGYDAFLQLYVLAIIASTGVVAAAYAYARWGAREEETRALG